MNNEIYREVFAGAHGGIFVVEGRDGHVVAANSAANELLDYPADGLLGTRIRDLFPEDERTAMADTLEDIWKNEGTEPIACRLLKAGGEALVVSFSAHVVTQNEKSYLVIFAHVVSDFATEQTRFAAMSRNRFVANLTHELRTPLNALIGMSDLLIDMGLEDEPHEAAVMVADSAKGLLSLVNDVLDFAKIESGKMELRRRPFQLKNTLKGLHNTFALQLSGKNLRHSLNLDANIPETLIGDEGRLRQVLVNLVGNALKFTSRGRVDLAVRLEEATDTQVRLHFSVTDTGCGIGADERSRLFEAFTQVGDPDAQPFAGTGLGLTISRQLVEMMGGTLGMTSEKGHGSTFWFSVPFVSEKPSDAALNAQPVVTAAQAAEALTSLQQGSDKTKPQSLHILVVEDNKVNQKVALGLIHKMGHTGVAADDGEHALELLRTGGFDLVFMDLQMPKLDGLATTRKIRAGAAQQHNQDIPIVAMTGHASQQDRQDCLDAGMSGYLAKPISNDRIFEAIKNLDASESASGRGAPFTMDGLLAQMNGDVELAVEILEIFCEDTEERLQRMAAAVTNYDFQAIGHEAQALEGGALNVRAEILVHLTRELRSAAAHQEQEYAASLIDELVMELAAMMQQT